MHNKTQEFNNIKYKPMIEYYDYSKSKNSLIQELNNPNAKPKKNMSNSYSSKYQEQGRKNYNNNPYNKFENQGQYNNQKFDNVIFFSLNF
jgi:hypothetical protein